jgi:hypothetical protein
MTDSKQHSLATLGLTAAIVLILLAPLAVYVLLRSSEPGPGMRQVTPETATPVERKAKVKRAYAEFDSKEGVIENQKRRSVRAAPATAQSARPVAARPFPTPANIPAGMEKSKLIASFGKPHMITTEVSQGRALETFHYLQPEAGTETVVQLDSGRVVSASTSVY